MAHWHLANKTLHAVVVPPRERGGVVDNALEVEFGSADLGVHEAHLVGLKITDDILSVFGIKPKLSVRLIVNNRWRDVVHTWRVTLLEPDQTVRSHLALKISLLTKDIWCLDRDIERETFVGVESSFVCSEEFVNRWNTIGDEPEYRIRVERIIFRERWCRKVDSCELYGSEPNSIGSWIVVQVGTFDEDINTSTEGCIKYSSRVFRLEKAGLGLLQGSFPVANTI